MNNLPVISKVEKMYRLPDAGNLKAFVDVSINDAFVIRGIRLLNGSKGFFVSLPQEQGKDGKWYDQVTCKNANVYDALTNVVLSYYNQGV